MNILCYSSCYGNVLKHKMNNIFNKFELITWFILENEVDYNLYKYYDTLLCEYVAPNKGFKSSDFFIKKLKNVNPNIIIYIYPLIIIHVFPFYQTEHICLSNKTIDDLLKRKTLNM